MIQKTISLLKKQHPHRVYSHVVAHDDTKNVTKLLKKAAKQANKDQRRLVSQ